MLTPTNRYCPVENCAASGIEEFYGFCPDCWLELSEEDRATLRGEQPRVKEIIRYSHVVTPPRWRQYVFLFWAGCVTGWIIWESLR